MAEFDPFPREPKIFPKFCPKTKADLAKQIAAVLLVLIA